MPKIEATSPWSAAQAHDIVSALLPWQRSHGRHDLPWQRTQDPYRVWLSEVMLQQTQVATVKAYYAKFLAACPDVQALARASTDEVMALWAGLGYYSRARNLHRCAQQVVSDWGGVFPAHAAGLQTLAGIGPSTAAAIASICYGERVAILDGNVKRVVARCLAWHQDVGDSASTQALQAAANALAQAVPAADDMPTLTQGLMDLGATVCKPRQADCQACPLVSLCEAHRQDKVMHYPIKRSRITRKSERWWLLLAQDQEGGWAVEQRPARGIWAALHAPPVFADQAQLAQQCQRLGGEVEVLPMVKHVLTHRDLFLYPMVLRGVPTGRASGLTAAGPVKWLKPQALQALGLPAPIKKLWLPLLAS